MEYKAKENSGVKWVYVFVHQTCLIINLDNKKNLLYDFNKADLLLIEIRQFLDEDKVKQVKEYITWNCSKVKFTENCDPPEQLSLFL